MSSKLTSFPSIARMEDQVKISDNDKRQGIGADKDSEVDGAAEARRILNSLVASRSLWLPRFFSCALSFIFSLLLQLLLSSFWPVILRLCVYLCFCFLIFSCPRKSSKQRVYATFAKVCG